MKELADQCLSLRKYLEMRLKGAHDRDEEDFIQKQVERLDGAENEVKIEMHKTIQSIMHTIEELEDDPEGDAAFEAGKDEAGP